MSQVPSDSVNPTLNATTPSIQDSTPISVPNPTQDSFAGSVPNPSTLAQPKCDPKTIQAKPFKSRALKARTRWVARAQVGRHQRQTINSLKSRVSALNLQVEVLEDELEKRKTNFQIIANENLDLLAHIRYLYDQLEEQSSELAEAQHDRDSYLDWGIRLAEVNDPDDLLQTNEELSKERDHYYWSLKDLKAEYHKYKEDKEDEIDSLQSEITALCLALATESSNRRAAAV